MPFHSDVTSALSNVFNEKLVQIAVVAGVLFYVVANPAVFKFVDENLKKLVNLSLSGNNLLIFHSFVYAVLLVIAVKYIFNPLMLKLKK